MEILTDLRYKRYFTGREVRKLQTGLALEKKTPLKITNCPFFALQSSCVRHFLSIKILYI